MPRNTILITLMLAAQGYQESMLNQNLRSPRGAVGINAGHPQDHAGPPHPLTSPTWA